jgi:hypothetical protein
MSDTLCKLVKHEILKKDFESYRKLVKKPTHICDKCGRAANDKKSLCSPKEI